MNTKTPIVAAIVGIVATSSVAFAAAHVSNALDTEKQKLSHAVVVKSVTAAADGWIVIHAIQDGKPVVPTSIGHTYVKAGMTEDVHVALTEEIEGDKVIAMLHVDDGELGVYEFGFNGVENDKPVVVDGKPLVMAIDIDS